MTEFAFPLATSVLMDTLGIEKVVWDVERYDEYDAQGTGHDIQSEMAAPKWTAAMVMRDLYNLEARRMAALVRKLHGSQNSFMVYDPSHKYPESDPKGLIIGANTVQINTIGSNNQSISVKGLTAGYVLTQGDKGQIVFASGARNFFFEFSQDVTANGSGNTTEVEIFPHIPIGVAVDATIILKKPACKMILRPKGFSPGQSSGPITSGAVLNAMEKV